MIQRAELHPAWGLGCADAVWWSRVAQPALPAWASDEQPLHVVEQTGASADPDPQALAASGVLLHQPLPPDHVWLRFVDGRPVSAVTTQFLQGCCTRLVQPHVPVWVLIWDNASWHISKAVRSWIRAHNRPVKRDAPGVRIVVCCLPVKSPGLNPIEPQWVHGKRAIIEPARLLTADEVADRVCAYYGCQHEDHLTIPDQAA